MAVLVWLLIPVAGGVVAGIWSAWATRRRSGGRNVRDSVGVRGYEAFRAAMERAPADG
ncbi:hypothetical protein RM844_04275 [Streptomyces sp. DSM 44915]|uniref:Uncharacterized protein n=1 Tax=Streptomyces chisholmiae TaxID=3075540 RepID=A0ABU2JL85_9ACTN|nr:hypothetical protein [Streptomyces sp. DSM 44915]MDT0265506.1 hypothetical protein [Streptomyces sp. DSM 44915]